MLEEEQEEQGETLQREQEDMNKDFTDKQTWETDVNE